jgi:hypothetical protein
MREGIDMLGGMRLFFEGIMSSDRDEALGG